MSALADTYGNLRQVPLKNLQNFKFLLKSISQLLKNMVVYSVELKTVSVLKMIEPLDLASIARH